VLGVGGRGLDETVVAGIMGVGRESGSVGDDFDVGIDDDDDILTSC
jgi:hypothetical protein